MSSQGTLFAEPPRRRRVTLGRQHHEAVDPKVDRPRLVSQFERIMAFMGEGRWYTQYEIAAALEIPQGSVGSQIRNARVDGYRIAKQRRGGKRSGTWEYRMEARP